MKITSLLAWPVICFVVLASHPLAAQTADNANKAKLEQRDQLWNQAIQVANEGKLDEATTLLEQVYSLEESVSGPAHPTLLEILSVHAQVAELKRDDKFVIDIRKRQHRVTEQIYGEKDYRTQDAKRAIAHAEQNATRSPEDRLRLQQAETLSAEVVKRYGDGNFASALLIAKEAAEIVKQILGEQHPFYANRLNDLARLHKKMGEYTTAESLYSQTVDIRKLVLGEHHPSYAISLNDLAELYRSIGDYARAESHYKKAMDIWEQVLGEQHRYFATGLNNLAQLYRTIGDYKRAEPLYRRAMEINKQALGEQDAVYAASLNNLAELYRVMGDYVQAEPLCVQAMEIRMKVLGDQHPDYAASLNNLALLYFAMGDYQRSLPLFTRAVGICRNVFGGQHPEYAKIVCNLALLYQSMGDYSRAEPLYVQAMEIRKTALGKQHPDYAISLNNLALLYSSVGDYQRAEPLLSETSEIFRQVFGEQNGDYAKSVSNLAELFRTMGDFKRAELFSTKAMDIRKQTLGELHPDYAASLNNLAILYLSIKDYERAEPLFAKTQEIYRHVLGDQHPEYATIVSNLAEFYRTMGDYNRAELFLVEAMEIQKQTLGELHPDYASSLNKLALTYKLAEDYSRSEPLYRRAIDISMRNLDETASILTEQQQIAMSQSLRYQLDNAVACALVMNPPPQTIAHQIVAWKGSALVRLRAARLAEDDPTISEVFRKLQAQTRQLSALTCAIPRRDGLDAWTAQVEELTSSKERLERELMRNSAVFRRTQTKFSLNDVRQSIPSDGLIVDYFEYGSTYKSLVATIIDRDVEPVMVDLGSAVDAGNAISVWRASLGADDEAKQAGEQLRKQLWEPLLPHIGDAKLVFVSPDGVLGQLPFAALPGKAKDSYLIEDHAVVMLPVPILLPSLMQRDAAESNRLASSTGRVTGLLMGDVDYDSASATAPKTPTTESNLSGSLLASSTVSRTRGDTTYSSLAGTGPEIDAIAKLFRSHRDVANQNLIELRKRDATESEFRAAAGSAQWLHLATHGFFAPEDKKNALSAAEIAKSKSSLQISGFDDRTQPRFIGFSPGQLSGLVFAGANQPPQPIDPLSSAQPIDDGIMTADEIAYMQLENVELAVLSACETGLGETAGGEGILGLQRAFQIAGARTTITSLWQVDDAATQALMIEFYRNLFEKKLSKLESLRQAQIWLLNNPDAIEGRDLTRGPERKTKVTDETKTAADKPTRSLPAYWAAFQLSGDPR